jgi:23S rRNA (adenine1618-N6)-methyltransferase
VARNIPGFPKHLLPFPADYKFTLPTETNIDSAISTMKSNLGSLSWYWNWDKSTSAGVGFASENVWSRQARRKMKLAKQAGIGHLDVIPQEVALGVRVQLKLLQGKEPESKEVQVSVRWIQGMDSVLFESFCGMLKRKMEDK